jgi:hypothetical protein
LSGQTVSSSGGTNSAIDYLAQSKISGSPGFRFGFWDQGASLIGGGSVGKTIAIYLTPSSIGTLADAAIADNDLFTSDWFINQSGTVPSTLGGVLTLTHSGTALVVNNNAQIGDGSTTLNPLLNLNSEAASVTNAGPYLTFLQAGTNGFKIGKYQPIVGGTNNADDIIDSGHNLFIYSGSSQTLELDTSQNATFAGDVTIDGLSGVGTRPVSVNSSGKLVAGSTAYTAPTIQRFLYTGSSTTYVPSANVLYFKVQAVGGGGGGASSNNGSGTIVAATAGGNTSFGGILSCTGGGAGTESTATTAAGVGGTVSLTGGTLIVDFAGGNGQGRSTIVTNETATQGGMGGSSFFGAPGAGGSGSINTLTFSGSAASGYGSGGGGGGGLSNGGTNAGGGGGAGGYAEFIVSGTLAASYSVLVGGGGAGGTASAGNNGGNGAAGIIIITEYYQ